MLCYPPTSAGERHPPQAPWASYQQGVVWWCRAAIAAQEVFKGHISALNHRVRSIAFGTPFCNHKKTREEIDERTWKNLFLTVVNRKDPLPPGALRTLIPSSEKNWTLGVRWQLL